MHFQKHPKKVLSADSAALSKQHSLSQTLSSGDVTELGSTSDENFKSPLQDALPTKKV